MNVKGILKQVYKSREFMVREEAQEQLLAQYMGVEKQALGVER